ncbi:MAG: ACP S-malonyltransferase, partial [Pseudomonas sp.]|nr:ACP S-malonyltransferase [Pseudomonas sp.]
AQGDVVSAVNFNAPGQVVIAGSATAVERAIEACKARGAKRAMALPVSVPSHCALMKPAAERFAESVEALSWQAPQIPLVQNVSAAVVSDLGTLKADLLAQLYSPVRWVESMVRLSEQGVTDLIECGPGKVLSGLNKRCVKGINTHNLDTPDAFAAARAALA